MGKNEYLAKKLGHDNFSVWDKQFRALMFKKDILKAGHLQTTSEFETETDKDEMLRAELMLNVEPFLLNKITASASGVDAYKELRDLSIKKNRATKMRLNQDLLSLRMRNDENLT